MGSRGWNSGLAVLYLLLWGRCRKQDSILENYITLLRMTLKIRVVGLPTRRRRNRFSYLSCTRTSQSSQVC